MIKKILKVLIPSIILLFLISSASKDLDLIFETLTQVDVKFLFLSLPFFLLIYPQGGYCWYIVLKKMNFKNDPVIVISIWIISNTSRYIPGTIWQYLGRFALAEEKLKLSKTQITTSMILEIYFVLIAAIVSSVFAISKLKSKTYLEVLLFGVLIFFIIIFIPSFIKFFSQKIPFVKKYQLEKIIPLINIKDYFKLLPTFILNFFLNGFALYFLVLSLNMDLNPLLIFTLTSFYAISWLLGFLSFFSPGGLGVTEASLAFLLSTIIPLPIATIIALLFRLILTLSEILVFVLFLNVNTIKAKINK